MEPRLFPLFKTGTYDVDSTARIEAPPDDEAPRVKTDVPSIPLIQSMKPNAKFEPVQSVRPVATMVTNTSGSTIPIHDKRIEKELIKEGKRQATNPDKMAVIQRINRVTSLLLPYFPLSVPANIFKAANLGLVANESNYDIKAKAKTSSAYGLFQLVKAAYKSAEQVFDKLPDSIKNEVKRDSAWDPYLYLGVIFCFMADATLRKYWAFSPSQGWHPTGKVLKNKRKQYTVTAQSRVSKYLDAVDGARYNQFAGYVLIRLAIHAEGELGMLQEAAPHYDMRAKKYYESAMQALPLV